jgi:thymidylate kinase
MPLSASSVAQASHSLPDAFITEPTGVTPSERPANLPERLAHALETSGIAYCQWKGTWGIGSEGDIDLLVDSEAIPRFRSLVQELDFKPVLPSGERQIPGVESYLGHDPAMARPLHLHVHFRLVVGDYWRTLYRLPIERPMLESSQPGDLFRIPSPPYQFLVYVLRMMLRLRSWPLPLSQARWLKGIQGQLDYLDGRSDQDELSEVLVQHLPIIDPRLLERCLQALRGQSDPAESAAVRWELHRRLRAHSRPPSLIALLAACGEKILPSPLRPMLFDGRMRPSRGGAVVALVGGDGAGKSTCARELCTWLGSDLPTFHAHLGRPARSLLTLLVGGALKAERLWYRLVRRDPPAVTHIELLRHLCTARDRHNLYSRVRRYAVAGGIAICERYPIPQSRALVGPCIAELIGSEPTRLGRLLRDAERRYYTRMLPPDTLFVLQLDPELAAARKLDEPADYVRARTRVIWETDWSRTSAQVIDVSRPLADVVQDLKARVWSVL